jgi:hypothetical protein
MRIARSEGGWAIESHDGRVRQLEPGAPVQWKRRGDLVAAIAKAWGQWVDRKGNIHPRGTA